MTLIRNREITRPTTTPLASSVLDHATVVEAGTFGLRNNDGLWLSYNCIDTLVPTPICPDPLSEEFKTFSSAVWVPGFEFAVHGAVQCQLIGLDRADQESEIRRVFALNEGKGVEEALLANRFVANLVGSDSPGAPWDAAWDTPDDLSAAGMTLAGAIAALEGYAAAIYAGVPTLHMPRAAVSFATSLGMIREEDGKFYTKTGAKIAAGGGYDSVSVPDGTFDIYATGEVFVERSETVSVSSITSPGDGSGIGSGQNGLSQNTAVALVERMFRVGVDCFVAKATGRAWGTP